MQHPPTTTWRRHMLPALLLSLAAGSAWSAPQSAEAVYKKERAACLDGSSAQDRSTCLKEAGAALAEARRRGLDNGETPAQLRANALQRCSRVPADDRAACERLALGDGQTSGSVAEGAVVKQLTERSVATTPAPTKAP